jgi:hypothetical protein
MDMRKFIVQVAEVHYSFREVEAESEEEAMEIAPGMEETLLEYSRTMDPEFWKVEEVK